MAYCLFCCRAVAYDNHFKAEGQLSDLENPHQIDLSTDRVHNRMRKKKNTAVVSLPRVLRQGSVLLL